METEYAGDQATTIRTMMMFYINTHTTAPRSKFSPRFFRMRLKFDFVQKNNLFFIKKLRLLFILDLKNNLLSKMRQLTFEMIMKRFKYVFLRHILMLLSNTFIQLSCELMIYFNSHEIFELIIKFISQHKVKKILSTLITT